MLHLSNYTIRTLQTLSRLMIASASSPSLMPARASAISPAILYPATDSATNSSSSSSSSTSVSSPSTVSFSKYVPIPANGVDYRGKVVLAPMVRSGELPSRMMALRYGADLVWGPETIDRAMIGTTRHMNEAVGTIDFTRRSSNHARNDGKQQQISQESKPDSVIYRLHPKAEARKLIFQMGTADPALAVQAARLVAGDVAGIDVNAGCPKPFSVVGGMGAALLRKPEHLAAILEALVTHIGSEYQIGISVKIRLLETPAETEALVRRLCATGITGLTVHCRTTPMRPRERAIREQLRMIASVCREAGVACVMNGDVADRDSAEALIREYGVDGAMIASAAEKNPSCFRSHDKGGLLHWRQLGREYLEMAMDVHNKFGNTKFLLAQMLPGKEREAQAVQQARSYEDVVVGLGLEDDHLERARKVDEVLGIRIKTAEGEWTQRTSKKKGSNKRASQSDGEINGGDAKRTNVAAPDNKIMPFSSKPQLEREVINPAVTLQQEQRLRQKSNQNFIPDVPAAPSETVNALTR